MEGKVMPDVGKNPHSKVGMANIIQVALVSIQKAPETAADLADALVRGGRLKTLDTANLMTILKAPDGDISDRYVGLYPALKTQTPAQKKRLTDIIYNDFRPLLIERLASVKDKDTESKLIDLIIDLNRLKKQVDGWRAIGTPKPLERTWRYMSFDPLTEKDKLHQREEKRLREITLPAGMENWYSPGFDDSNWNSGKTPIGTGHFKAHGHGMMWTYRPNFFYENNSDWGDGEFIVMRNEFEVDDLDFEYFRISILSYQGYNIYLNGHKIHSFIWFWHYPHYVKTILTERELKYLKKGTNTLAVMGFSGYEKDRNKEEYHPIAQVDLYIEGLKKSDLTANSYSVSMPWDDPSNNPGFSK